MAKTDWEAIQQEYRTGRFSLQQLSDRHGVNRSNISRRARKYGWEKDLTEKVRQRTREKVSRATLPPEATEATDALNDEDVIEFAAGENAAVVKGHRKSLIRWRGIAERYAEILESQLAQGKLQVEGSDGTEEIDIPLEYIGKCMGYGTQALDRIINAERKNYGLDIEDGGDEPPERALTDDDLDARIDKLRHELGEG